MTCVLGIVPGRYTRLTGRGAATGAARFSRSRHDSRSARGPSPPRPVESEAWLDTVSEELAGEGGTLVLRRVHLLGSQAIRLVATIENNKLAYFGIAVAIFLILIVFYLLIKEIRRTERISEELRERKEHFKVTLNSIGEGLITTNLAGDILYMNPSANRLTGWNWHEAKNQPLHSNYTIRNSLT